MHRALSKAQHTEGKEIKTFLKNGISKGTLCEFWMKKNLVGEKIQIKDDEKRIKIKAAYVTLIERFEWKSWWIENSIWFICELHSKRNESRARKVR